MRHLNILVGLSCLTLCLPTANAGKKSQPLLTIGPAVSGHDGMVVSSNNDAARVGAMVLSQGGNAIDAAIAMEFALNVSEPAFSGIGGGGFMLIREAATGDVVIIDSRERAPASATPDMFLVDLDNDGQIDDPIPFATRRTLGIAVGVPGALAGAQAALDLFGTWSLKQTLAPAVALAEDGVVVTQLLAESIAANQSLLAANPAARAVFLPGGQPLAAGDSLVQRDLADTFRLLQKQGIEAFYGGELGEAFVAEVQAAGGGMTVEDLESYEITLDDPVRGFYGEYEILSAAPPTSGGLTVLQSLAILERLDISQYADDPVARYHLLLQSLHLAFADRNAYLGDPEFVDIPLAGWLDPAYIAARAGLLDPDAYTCPIAAGPVPGSMSTSPGESADLGASTTHLTVTDRWGNIVAFTTTIEQVFGTGRMLPGYGLMLNNELTDFNPIPGGPNEVQPNKRPLSSIAPTVLLADGEPVLTIGSPGGPRIIGSIVQVLVNILDLDIDLQTAVSMPRVFSSTCATTTPNVRWDSGFPNDIRAGLIELGYVFEPTPQEVGNVNLIGIEDDTYTGIADPRREGIAIGLTDGPGKPGKGG